MRATASVASRSAVKMSPSAARRHILNCYDIVNASTLAWPVNLYSLRLEAAGRTTTVTFGPPRVEEHVLAVAKAPGASMAVRLRR